jgi:hypothetical protein
MKFILITLTPSKAKAVPLKAMKALLGEDVYSSY